jgi:hypothetical protein
MVERHTGFDTFDLRLGNEAARHPRFSPTLQKSARPCNFLRVSHHRVRLRFHEPPRGFSSVHVPSVCTRAGKSSASETLNVPQVAALLGCSTARVYELCDRAELPHYRDRQNAIRFDCGTLGKVWLLASKR